MFDVFVTGIDPNRVEELEDIKQNVSRTLGITGNDLDTLISPQGSTVCIQENVPEETAIKVRAALIKMGLVCTYKPRSNSRWGELSIEEIDEKPFADGFTCPACQHKQDLDGEPEPQSCPSCGINIEKYRQDLKDQEEYKALRENLLRRSQARRAHEEKEKQKEEEKQRKADMENKIKLELGLQPKSNWKAFFDGGQVNKTYLLAGGGLLVVVLGFLIFGSGSESSPESLQAQNTQNAIPSDAAVQTGGESSAVGGQAEPANGELSVQQTLKTAANVAAGSQQQSHIDITDTPPTANALDLVVADGQTDGQAAMAQTHANVAKFLGSIGIDADSEAAKASAVSSPATVTAKAADASLGLPAAAIPATAGAAVSAEAVTATTAVTPNSAPISGNRLFLESIYHDLRTDIEWDAFLNKQAKEQVKAGKLKSAYALSQAQSNLNDQLGVMGELLASFSKLGRSDLVDSTVKQLTQRIQAQPAALQPIYHAQLGLALQSIGGKQNLVEEAEKQASEIADPAKQSWALSKIAVNEKNAGYPGYSKNFAQAEDKLKSMTPSFQQFSGYVNLARAYHKTGNPTNAEVAMIMAELSLVKLPESQQEDSLVLLLDTAYSLNDPAYINKYSTRIRQASYRSKAAYQNILSQLSDSTGANVFKPISNISETDYAAIANAIAGLIETDHVMQASWLDTAQQKAQLITDSETKAVVASKVGRYLARLGKEKEAAELFNQALMAAQLIQYPKQRDAALFLLTIDKARVFLTDSAGQTAGLIQDEQLKAAALDMIKDAQAVKGLIS